MPSWLPMSYSAQMCGWLRLETARASRSRRWRSSECPANSDGSTFMATLRFRRVSRALYTSPIPPAPIGARISYGPSRIPVESDIRLQVYLASGDGGGRPSGRKRRKPKLQGSPHVETSRCAGQNDLASIIPPWAHEGGSAALIRRLKDPSLRPRLESEIEHGIPGSSWYDHTLRRAVGRECCS